MFFVGAQVVHVCFDTGVLTVFVCVGVADYGELGKMSFWSCGACGSTRAGRSLGLAY